MNAVEFRELSKTYSSRGERRVALVNLTLDIPEGQIYGFAGPNGAGKSTCIKILVGLVKASSGTVQIFGHQAGTLKARQLLGFLPEVTLYHEHMGAEELLGVHARLAGLPRAEHKTRIREVLEIVGLEDRGRSRISEFSKGMKQRFGIAQAILARPRLLVLDELTSGLDPHAQANLLALLEKLKEQGLTIFFSSHHLAEIEKVCDSVAIVHRGILRAHGSLDELLGDGRRVTITARPAEGSRFEGTDWQGHPDGSATRSVPKSECSAVLQSLHLQGAEILALKAERQSLDALFHRLTPEREELAS
jgi:ABC-2 type transport system ATP-binding protein